MLFNALGGELAIRMLFYVLVAELAIRMLFYVLRGRAGQKNTILCFDGKASH